MIYFWEYLSPMGRITAASNGTHLLELWFDTQRHTYSPENQESSFSMIPVFQQLNRWLDLYFQGKEPNFLPPLSPTGSPYQKTIWNMLLQIPYGSVVTYGKLAQDVSIAMKKKPCSQAVGGAVGSNPISILIPCHRVVGAGNNLTGYGGGIPLKIKLLSLEGIDVQAYHTPNSKKSVSPYLR